MRIARTAVGVAIGLWLSVCAGLAETAAPYAFVGAWDCEVATFTFTDTTYNNGSEDLPIRKITEDGGAFQLDFDDGYMISLGNVTDTTMDWVSGETYDQFACKRIK